DRRPQIIDDLGLILLASSPPLHPAVSLRSVGLVTKRNDLEEIGHVNLEALLAPDPRYRRNHLDGDLLAHGFQVCSRPDLLHGDKNENPFLWKRRQNAV